MAGKGLFIVLEGIDGSGKDTHLKFLAKELRELGVSDEAYRKIVRDNTIRAFGLED